MISQAGDGGIHIDAFELFALGPEPPLPPTLPDGRGKKREVALGDNVDRGPHQRALHDTPLLERLRQRLAFEVVKA
jgi:hypothetical protein